MMRTKTSFIAFYPCAQDARKPAEIAASVAAKLGRGWRGIMFVPGGKATAQLRKQLTALGNERGFVVFTPDPGSEPKLVGTKVARSANGIFVAEGDEANPARGFAEINQVMLTEY